MITNSTAEPIVFKQEFSPKNGWLNYGLAITVLLIVILVLAKKYKSRPPNLAGCQLVEKKHLGNKTVVYVVEYQQQRFLLADNQHALAIHPVESVLNKGEQPLAPTSTSNSQHVDANANVGASGAHPSTPSRPSLDGRKS